MLVDFVKMHGAGNDFVLVDEFRKNVVPDKEKKAFVVKCCDRHFGVGGDGLIFVQKSSRADARFVFYNPDGSRAEMCGNGIRCFGKYVYERGLVKKNPLKVESLAGIKTIELLLEKGKVVGAKVDMGLPKVEYVDKEVEVGCERYHMSSVNMGNPHVVIFVKDAAGVDVVGRGREIRRNLVLFPEGTNVHFVEKIVKNEYRIRSYERGVEGETLACGTGICASAAAAVAMQYADSKKSILFHARGGDVLIDFGKDDRVYMSGPAEEVFTGKIKA